MVRSKPYWTPFLESAVPCLSGCQTWTLRAGWGKVKAFETQCLRKLLHIYLVHKTSGWIFLVGPKERLLAAVKRQKHAWFGHHTCHDSLSKTILQGSFESGRFYGRQRKYWIDNTKEWTSLPMPELLTMTSCRKNRKRISAELPLMFPPRPSGSRDSTDQLATFEQIGQTGQVAHVT